MVGWLVLASIVFILICFRGLGNLLEKRGRDKEKLERERYLNELNAKYIELSKKAEEELVKKSTQRSNVIEELASKYVKASFTKECADLILKHYQESIDFCKNQEISQWKCTIGYRNIECKIGSEWIIDYKSHDFSSLEFEEIEAFTQAIVKILKNGFQYKYVDYDGTFYIYHNIQLAKTNKIIDG